VSNPNSSTGSGETANSGRESLLHRIATSKTTGRVAIVAAASGLTASMLTIPGHKVETIVRQDAPAMEQFVNQSTPAMLESGTKLTAECRRDNGTVVVSESDASIYTLYTIDPNMLQAGEPNAAPNAWVNDLATCGQ